MQEPVYETVLVGGMEAICADYLPSDQQAEGEERRFLLSVKDGQSLVYECTFDNETAISEVPVGSASTNNNADACFLRFVKNPIDGPKLLLMGTTDGMVTVRPANALSAFLRLKGHDMHRGRVSGVAIAFDGCLVLSSAFDGLLPTHDVDLKSAMEHVREVHEALRKGLKVPIGATKEEAAEKAAEDARQGLEGLKLSAPLTKALTSRRRVPTLSRTPS